MTLIYSEYTWAIRALTKEFDQKRALTKELIFISTSHQENQGGFELATYKIRDFVVLEDIECRYCVLEIQILNGNPRYKQEVLPILLLH